MKKNTVLAIVLSMIVIGAAMYIQQKYFPPERTAVSEKPEPAAQTADTDILQNTFSQPEAEEKKTVTLTDAGTDSQVPSSEQSYTVETDLIKAVFTNKGGDIISYKLKEHASANGTDRVEMAENITAENRAFSVAFGGADSRAVDLLFNVKEETLPDGKKQIGFYRDIAVKNAVDGSEIIFTLAKRYTFIPGDYMFTLEIAVEGKDGMKGLAFGEEAYTLRTSPQIGPEWDAAKDRYEYRYFSYFVDGKKNEERGITAGKTKVITRLASWASVSGKYFALIVIPKDPIQKMTFSGFKEQKAPLYNSQIFLSRPPITGNSSLDQYRIYIGPSSEKVLNIYNSAVSNNYGYDNLRIDAVAASGGFLQPLEWLLKKAMELLYKLIPNWGVAVILLTILMRAVFFPLTKKSSQATQKMQEMQPQITALQTKYKNNPQKLNAEMAQLYKDAGYNPISGCLPMLIQLPILFAMYRLFNNYFEFRGASFIPGWIPDLSVGDSVLKFGFSLPFLGWSDLRILPIVYVISQLLYGKLTQTPGQAQQNSSMKLMLYFMPLFFFFIFYNAPSGLLLFWIFSNVLMLLQQVFINRAMKKKKS